MGLLLCGCQQVRPSQRPALRTPQELDRKSSEVALPEPEPYVRVINGQEVHDLKDIPAATKAPAAPGAPAAPEAPAIATKRSNTLDQIILEEVNFSDMRMGQVAVMLTRLIGQNIVASSEARDKSINLYLRNISARAAIEALCRLNGLWYREDAEMVRLLTKDEYSKELVIKSDEQTRLYYLKNASALGVADMIASLMPDQVEYTRPQEEASYGHVGTDGDSAMNQNGSGFGNNQSGFNGNSQSGINGNNGNNINNNNNNFNNNNNNINNGNNSGFSNRNYPSLGSNVNRTSYNYSLSDVTNNFQKGLTTGRVEELAKDAATHQKGEVSGKSAIESAGIKAPVSLSVFLRNNCIGVRTLQESAHREIGALIEALDTPTRQVLLEVKVLRLALNNGFETLFSASYTNSTTPRITANWLGGATFTGSTVSFGYLDEHVTATMNAMQTDNRLQTIATPMLLCANNAPGEFFSGVRQLITVGYEFETRFNVSGQTVDVARPTTQFVEIGTTVRIKPSINADGTVTLRFYLELSSINVGGSSVSQITQQGEVVQLPIDTVNSENTDSIIVANHGQAVVMGGLISDSIHNNKQRVPLIGDVPVLGTFFGKKNKNKDRSEMVVVIIPHIMGTPAQGEPASDAVLKRMSAHPWVTEEKENLTKWDATQERLKENKTKR